jgi:hypothetical protein
VGRRDAARRGPNFVSRNPELADDTHRDDDSDVVRTCNNVQSLAMPTESVLSNHDSQARDRNESRECEVTSDVRRKQWSTAVEEVAY